MPVLLARFHRPHQPKPPLEGRWRAKRDGEVSRQMLPNARCVPRQRPHQPGSALHVAGLLQASGGGLFRAVRVPKTRRGLRPPVPHGAARRASPGVATRKLFRPIGPVSVVPWYPIRASRGPVESDSRYGYRGLLKGRTQCPGTWGGCCTRQLIGRFRRGRCPHRPAPL